VLSVLADASESYDEKADLDGFYLVRNVLGQNPAPYLNMVTQPASRDQSSLHATVLNIVDEFQKMTEEEQFQKMKETIMIMIEYENQVVEIENQIAENIMKVRLGFKHLERLFKSPLTKLTKTEMKIVNDAIFKIKQFTEKQITKYKKLHQ
jgi:lysyl-tRNA synthetase class I